LGESYDEVTSFNVRFFQATQQTEWRTVLEARLSYDFRGVSPGGVSGVDGGIVIGSRRSMAALSSMYSVPAFPLFRRRIL